MPLNPVPNYPTSLDTLPDPTSGTYTDDDGFELDLLLSKLNAIAEALEAKVGIGASTPVAGKPLRGTATGTSGWVDGPRAQVYHNAAQSAANTTSTILAFNQETYDTDAIHDNSTNNTRLTCKTAGLYIISAGIEFQAHATGTRWLGIRLNGTTMLRWSIGPNGGAQVGAPVLTVQAVLAVNDYVEAVAWQDSGNVGGLNVLASAGRSPYFEMVQVG